jgi:hypothetical protein
MAWQRRQQSWPRSLSTGYPATLSYKMSIAPL